MTPSNPDHDLTMRASSVAPEPDAGIEARLLELERIVVAQQRQIASLLEPKSDVGTITRGAAPARPSAAAVDRRGLLKHAGFATAGVLGAGSVLAVAQAAPAAAGNGDALVGGAFNAATNVTELGVGTGGNLAGKAALVVTDGAVLTGETDVFSVSAVAEGSATTGGLFAKGVSTGVKSIGTALNGAGVHGVATGSGVSSAGVKGTTATGGYGVLALNTSSYGVGLRASSVGSWGVVAQSALHSALLLQPFGIAPPARSDQHLAGELHMDETGRLWSCVVTGTPGSWRQVSGPDTAGAFHLLPTQTRIYDSRPGAVPLGCVKGRFNNQTRAIDATFNGSGVPLGATGVLTNVTATNTNAGGFVAVYKNGVPYPATSTVSWGALSSTVSNSAVVAVDAAALFACFCPVQADVIIDVVGYYR